MMAAVQKPVIQEPTFSFGKGFVASQTTDRSARKQKVASAGAWADTGGEKPKALDARFADVKKRLVKPEHYAALQESWDRLLLALEERVKVIEDAGPDVSLWEESPSGVL